MKSVPPPQKNELGHKRWATVTLIRCTLLIFFTGGFLGKKIWKILSYSLIILQGVDISLLYAAYSISSFSKLVFSLVLHTMKWKEQCRELFNQYTEYMVELNDCLENFEESVRNVEQSLSDDYEDLIHWAKCTEVRCEKLE